MRKGLLIVFSGPSGVGKGTVRKIFEAHEDLNLAFSVSMTTRAPRAGEQHGREYFFVTDAEFEATKANNGFLETAEFAGNKYGTPVAYVNKLLSEGKNVLLEIEVVGALQVINKRPDALSIFLTPPSIEELESRLVGRATETPEKIALRLKKAHEEIKQQSNYSYVVLNDDVNRAANEITAIIRKEMSK